MNYYFKNFPTVDYDLLKNGNKITVPNLTVRYKIQDIVKRRRAAFYSYNIEEGERPDLVAFKWYQDASLDWIILLTNDIVDPQFEWPLDREAFEGYVTKKYGSVTTAYETVHHYEMILQHQTVTYDGLTVAENYVEVDEATYLTTDPNDRRSVTAYEFEDRLNAARREIKILDPKFVNVIRNQVEEIFE
jgi:hypothetical protein